MSSSVARLFPGIFTRGNDSGEHAQTLDGSNDGSESSCERRRAEEAQVSDESLLLRLQEKDISVLGLLYRRYAKLVYSLCSRIIGDPAEAEDVVHEVFLSLYRRCGSFDPTKGSAKSWLVQLTYHRCFDWRDYLKTRHGFHQENGRERKPCTLPEFAEDRDLVEQAMLVASVRDAFAKLPREQQLAFKMRSSGCSFFEIAERLGCSHGNAKNHFYRGMRRLRDVVFHSNGAGTPEPVKLNSKSAAQ